MLWESLGSQSHLFSINFKVQGAWRISPVDVRGEFSHGDRFRPLRIGLWDPFQMAVSWLINEGLLTVY